MFQLSSRSTVKTLLASARKTGRVVTAEEAQASGGFGSAVAEFLGETLPMPVKRIGMNDRYGESGTPDELMEYFGFTGDKLVETIQAFIKDMPQYHR